MKLFLSITFFIMSISATAFADMPGTRNFTNVISGVLSFGGGKQEGRSNQNPLQDTALNALCENGYGEAIYLYDTNAIEKSLACGSNEIYYHHIDWRNPEEIMARIYKAIQSGKGSVYVHCWNGRHASNAIAAVALKQFCGWSNDEAAAFWDRHSDNSSGDVRKWSIKRITNYKVNPAYSLSSEVMKQVCP